MKNCVEVEIHMNSKFIHSHLYLDLSTAPLGSSLSFYQHDILYLRPQGKSSLFIKVMFIRPETQSRLKTYTCDPVKVTTE